MGLIAYISGFFSFIILPENLFPGDVIISSEMAKIKIGNSLLIKNIPLNVPIHNIELIPKKGGQLSRSAGCFSFIVKKTLLYAGLSLNSKKLVNGRIFLILLSCSATIGKVSNRNFRFSILRKAGVRRNKNFRPVVRGVAKNPFDHPHGGGEGKKSSKAVSMSP